MYVCAHKAHAIMLHDRDPGRQNAFPKRDHFAGQRSFCVRYMVRLRKPSSNGYARPGSSPGGAWSQFDKHRVSMKHTMSILDAQEQKPVYDTNKNYTGPPEKAAVVNSAGVMVKR